MIIDARVSSATPDLAPFDVVALHDDPSTICALDADLRISYVNRAWSRFAEANGAVWPAGAWGVGTPILSAVPDVLQPFYKRLFTSALERREVVEHDYECSSPEVLRRFRMRLMPLHDTALLVVHGLRQEIPHPSLAEPALEERYRDVHGYIVQCAHCRRVRRAEPTAAWDWVPSFVTRPQPALSHGLCAPCAAYYYPGLF